MGNLHSGGCRVELTIVPKGAPRTQRTSSMYIIISCALHIIGPESLAFMRWHQCPRRYYIALSKWLYPYRCIEREV